MLKECIILLIDMQETKLNWVEAELRVLGYPYDKETVDKCVYAFHNKEYCKRLGLDYTKLPLEDRRKIYWRIVSGDFVL